jgi:type II secretory pathway pseudopilin PulG
VKKLPLAELVVALVVLAAGVGVYLFAHRDQSAIEATKQSGDLIVAALERHRDDTGRYPDALERLVPGQLGRVPPPAWGEQWMYGTFEDGAHAELSVRRPDGRLTLRYDFTARRWALDN